MNGPFRSSSAQPRSVAPPYIGPPLSLWTVYERPKDFPTEIVARRWLVDGEVDTPKHTDEVIRAGSIEEIRDAMKARGLFRLRRLDGDDPVIVEVWL